MWKKRSKFERGVLDRQIKELKKSSGRLVYQNTEIPLGERVILFLKMYPAMRLQDAATYFGVSLGTVCQITHRYKHRHSKKLMAVEYQIPFDFGEERGIANEWSLPKR